MTLRVVGAGLGRTGTMSLKLALEKLLGGPCYHMLEVLSHPEHVPEWHRAARGEMPDWSTLLAGYRAAVDWPASAFWPELAAAYPDAVVLLSVRDPDAWWESASQTIFKGIAHAEERGVPEMAERLAMVRDLFAQRFVWPPDQEALAKAAFERHNARVRASVPRERLLEWQASDGWGPICQALGVAVPDEPFPRSNTREDWLARFATAVTPR
jgi:Sulfotransferase domain